ncbi:MAG TPA: helix-turn-helix transcriptional regulator, partial [Oscillospiraceae bacterium]|nr:helix-turn-helix transcriptional regulator [Oscillospiraceae bacterium]
MNVESGIPARIRELREVCGYSVEEFAEALGIDAKTYAGYEKDGADIPISVIFQVANKCSVDFNEIVTGTSAKLNTYHI